MMEPPLSSIPTIDDNTRSSTPTLAFKNRISWVPASERVLPAEITHFDTKVRAGVLMTLEIQMLASPNQKGTPSYDGPFQSRPSAAPANDLHETLTA
jgi:hypothetical protein